MLHTLSLVLVFCIPQAQGSFGDKSDPFVNCLGDCLNSSDLCYAEKWNVTLWHQLQPMHLRILQWTCDEECKYECMWITTDHFVLGYNYTPQFYGKWPFKRLLGVQEPASVLFSLTNMIPILIMIKSFIAKVPRDAPLFFENILHAVISVNAWTWSIIFHTRDFPLTEKLDYFCALSLVMFSVYYCLCRMLVSKSRVYRSAIGVAMLGFFVQHVLYMSLVKFDYGYNMRVNVSFGIINFLIWLVFCIRGFKRAVHYRYMLLLNVLLACFLPIELLDFPPLWWTLDAHALWHAFTSPLPFLWYKFTIADCLMLRNEKLRHTKKSN